MLMGTVAGVYDGDRSNLGGILGSTLDIVAHHNHVGIVGYHQDRVFQRLTFRSTGDLGICKADDTGTETIGCRLKTKTGSRGRFKEQGSHDYSLQQFPVGVLLKLLCHLNHVKDLFTCEIGNRYKIMLFHPLFSFCLRKITHYF